MKKILLTLTLLLFLLNQLEAQNLFVSTDGNDSNSGSIDSPLKSISTAVSKITAGDTIFVRGGVYNSSSTINITKNGTESSMYHLFNYNGERVTLNFSVVAVGTKGIKLSANYWYLKGINVTKAGHNGIGITGSHNKVELCALYENRNSGMQLDNGASYNRIINCDSYYNNDSHNNGADADGFAPKLTVGTGNYFYGCRSWANTDDGWDGYMRGADNVTTTLENCWTFNNGYTKDGIDLGPQANGNGFKMGGGDNSNGLHLMHHFILKNCLSFDNKVKGFDQNNNDGSMTLYNCTGFGNKTANYRITRQVNAGQTVTINNCVSLNGNVDLGSFVVQNSNGWMSPFVVTNADFVSIDTTGVRGPRKFDGSLPDVNFMHLVQGSDLIDAGIDLGLPFNGLAPDLGAFEFGTVSSIKYHQEIPSDFVLEQSYPNPFNPSTIIRFKIPMVDALSPVEAHVTLKVYDVLGKEVAVLVNESKSPGNYEVKFDGSRLTSGIYFYVLNSGKISLAKKMILMK